MNMIFNKSLTFLALKQSLVLVLTRGFHQSHDGAILFRHARGFRFHQQHFCASTMGK